MQSVRMGSRGRILNIGFCPEAATAHGRTSAQMKSTYACINTRTHAPLPCLERGLPVIRVKHGAGEEEDGDDTQGRQHAPHNKKVGKIGELAQHGANESANTKVPVLLARLLLPLVRVFANACVWALWAL